MSGGFSGVIGFMFTFFIVAFSFSAVFYSYEKQITDNLYLLNSLETKANDNYNSDFNIINPFYMSGRLNYQINNLNNNLYFLKKDKFCFTFIDNGIYVDNSLNSINILKHIPSSYSFIKKNNLGILSSKINFNESKINNYKIISCSGVEKNIRIDPNKSDWWDENWLNRKIVNVTNNANSNLAEYQVEVDLNSTNFDFTLGRENEIRFLYPLKNSLVLDSTFDIYSQNLVDYSSFSNSQFLGVNSGVETTDPKKLDKSVLLAGLNFDGVNDKITISSNSSLYLNNSLTYSSWVKWSGAGNTFQNIFTNGGWQNSIRIVNDGGVNQGKVLFQLSIDGVQKYLYSNVTLDTKWHFLSSTYDGSQMKIYLDSILVGNLSVVGNVDVQSLDNFIGSEGAGFYFNGSLDEVKIFNIDLKENEIKDLYYNNLRFRELSYFVSNFDFINKKSKLFVKIPAIQSNSSIDFHIYYDNRNGISSKSSIENTFNYTTPRTVGYVLSDKISLTNGLNIFSLYNNNTIKVGTNTFNLNEQKSSVLGAASINLNDKVKMKYLSQVDGQADADDIIAPISWAGTQFYYRGFRKTGVNDRFCMLSPFGLSNVEIRNASILVWSGNINSLGSCISLNIGTNSNLAINSSIPILVSYYGAGTQDSFVFYPATNEDLYGMPSGAGFLGTGSLGLNLDVYRSFGSLLQSYTIGSYGVASFGGGGTQGSVAGHKLVSTNGGLMGAIQQADGDGTESSVFVTKKEFGTKFGSAEGNEYVALVSDVADANCTSYDSLGVLKTNIPVGTGQNGIYNYSFDVGNSLTYLGPNWKVECLKPVWGYFEEDIQGDETNFYTHPMMRQYIWPEPSISIN